MLEFENAEKFDVAGRGTIFAVKNPVACTGFSHLLGQTVKINGELWTVRGVESFATAHKSVGTPIGLLVKKGEQNA